MESKYITYPTSPVSTNYNDSGRTYILEFHQEGIIDSRDIEITLDYKKDYPTRLFMRFEIYYNDKLIAANFYPEHLIINDIKDSKVYHVSDLFPNYNFRLDTNNKPLKLKLLRNPIEAIVNDIKITYTLSDLNKLEPLTQFKSLISPLMPDKFTLIMEHKPINIKSGFVSGHISPNNYSEKPIQEKKTNIIRHLLNDEEVSDPTIQKGLNIYFTDIEDKESYLVVYYTY